MNGFLEIYSAEYLILYNIKAVRKLFLPRQGVVTKEHTPQSSCFKPSAMPSSRHASCVNFVAQAPMVMSGRNQFLIANKVSMST